MATVARRALLVLLVLNGVFFASNIYVLGDTAAAIAMHDDLAPTASPFVANLKVAVCFATGVLYLLAALGFVRRRPALVACGVWGFAVFDGLYLYELAAWGLSHPRVWLDFAVFGGLALLFGVSAWREQRRQTVMQAAA